MSGVVPLLPICLHSKDRDDFASTLSSSNIMSNSHDCRVTLGICVFGERFYESRSSFGSPSTIRRIPRSYVTQQGLLVVRVLLFSHSYLSPCFRDIASLIGKSVGR